MSLVKRTLEVTNHPHYVDKEFTLIVTTRAGAFEGNPVDFEDGVLRLSVYGLIAENCNDLFIAESAIEMIEIYWKDTFGLCNGDEAAVIAHAERLAATVKRQAL